jgi:hypothetical protein
MHNVMPAAFRYRRPLETVIMPRRATGSGAGPSRWTAGVFGSVWCCCGRDSNTRCNLPFYEPHVGKKRWVTAGKIAAKNYSTTRSHLVSHGITECGSRMVKYR